MVVSHSLLTWRSATGPTTIDGKHPPFLVWKYKVKGDDPLSVTKVLMAWHASFCSVCEEHQDKWILVVENLGVQWVCVCLLLFRAGDWSIEPIGDVSLLLAGRYRYLFLSPFFPAISFLTSYLASAVFFLKFFYFFLYIILTYVLALYLLLTRCLHCINLHYLQYIYYNTIILVKLNYSWSIYVIVCMLIVRVTNKNFVC